MPGLKSLNLFNAYLCHAYRIYIYNKEQCYTITYALVDKH